MVINKKFFKQRTLMILDMLICLICALFVSIFFYKIDIISNINIEIIVVSVILLPLTMVISMILFNGYNKSQGMDDKQFNRFMLAIFLGIVIYIIQDFVFGYYKIIAYKIVSSLIASILMIQSRIIRAEYISKQSQVVKNEDEKLEIYKSIDGFVDEFLGKYITSLNDTDVNKFFLGKCIMIVGGAGFIGSNLTMKLASYQCAKIIIVDIDENNLYELKTRVEQYIEDSMEIVTEIASIRDYKKMDTLFAKYRPDIVYHSAAHKNIVLAEQCSEEAVKNNVFGTYTCAKLADIYRVDRFVLMSDLYVSNPRSIFGATKRIGELIMRYMSSKTKCTKYTILKFCNVLGSRGSVLTIFDEQIRNGGPITVCNNVSRRYIRVEETVENIIKVSMLTKGNDVYTLDCGREIFVKNLAQKFVKYKGLKLNKDIKIEYIGNKMFENVQYTGGGIGELTEYRDLYVIHNDIMETSDLYKKLNILNVAAKENDRDNIHKIILEILYLFDDNEYLTIDEIRAVNDEQQISLRLEEFYDEAL